MSWHFLDEVLKKFCFVRRWRRWIAGCYSGANFPIIMNNVSTTYCKSSRGIIQGDPLLHYFILVGESCGRFIVEMKGKSRMKALNPSYIGNGITHLQFIDDNILLGRPKASEAKEWKRILSLYENVSHQKLISDNSNVYFINVDVVKHARLARILGCNLATLRVAYLGMSLLTGECKGSSLESAD